MIITITFMTILYIIPIIVYYRHTNAEINYSEFNLRYYRDHYSNIYDFIDEDTSFIITNIIITIIEGIIFLIEKFRPQGTLSIIPFHWLGFIGCLILTVGLSNISEYAALLLLKKKYHIVDREDIQEHNTEDELRKLKSENDYLKSENDYLQNELNEVFSELHSYDSEVVNSPTSTSNPEPDPESKKNPLTKFSSRFQYLEY